MRRIFIPAIAALALVGVAACSPDESDFAGEAEDFIEDEDDEVAAQMEMTFTDAECEEPDSTETGATFTCTAMGSDGNSYLFTAEIEGERSFQITGVTMDEGGATAGSTPTAGSTAPATDETAVTATTTGG